MIATLVYVDVKPECIEAFKEITAYNHNNTRKEPGNIRFDVLGQRRTLQDLFCTRFLKVRRQLPHTR